MNTSSAIKAVIFGITALLFTTGSALAETKTTSINLCVGDTAIVEAGANEILTYTSFEDSKKSFTHMNMEARNAHIRAWEISDMDGASVWTELRPNVGLLEANPTTYAKSPVSYLRDLAEEGENRMVIQARAEGKQSAEYFATNLDTMKEVKHVVKLNVRQCGASTAIDSELENYRCEGQLAYASQGSRIIGGQRSMHHFVGAESKRGYFAAQVPGRVTFQHFSNEGGKYREMVTVLPNGKATCGYADEARLEALEGENAYLLQMCTGDVWMTPFQQPVRKLMVGAAKGKLGGEANISAETSLNRDGVLVKATAEGTSKLHVQFGQKDAAPAIIYVEAVSCN